jgi:hypothetical protein
MSNQEGEHPQLPCIPLQDEKDSNEKLILIVILIILIIFLVLLISVKGFCKIIINRNNSECCGKSNCQMQQDIEE